MRRTFVTLLLLSFLLPSQNIIASASGDTQTTGLEPAAGSVVCPPGVYSVTPGDCVPLGPSEYLATTALSGIPYPILPLPAYPPDSSWNYLPYRYYKVNGNGTPLFASLADAIANNSWNALAPGLLYVSYQDLVTTDQGGFFLLRSGEWIRPDGARAAVPVFQGLLFSSQPRYPFGWVLSEVESRIAPGVDSPGSKHSWYRYNVVQIFATQTVDNIVWDLVAPDEWVEARYVARVDLRSAPPDGVTANRWIEVNLYEQTLSVYENNRLIFATLVSTGENGLWTRPGIFHIYQKKDTETMSNETEAEQSGYYYLEDVPWTMYFDEKRALHGEYWHTQLGYQFSHGCVNMSVGDAHWLYDWANLDELVYVFDPSGRTPTDPSLFGTGAP